MGTQTWTQLNIDRSQQEKQQVRKVNFSGTRRVAQPATPTQWFSFFRNCDFLAWAQGRLSECFPLPQPGQSLWCQSSKFEHVKCERVLWGQRLISVTGGCLHGKAGVWQPCPVELRQGEPTLGHGQGTPSWFWPQTECFGSPSWQFGGLVKWYINSDIPSSMRSREHTSTLLLGFVFSLKKKKMKFVYTFITFQSQIWMGMNYYNFTVNKKALRTLGLPVLYLCSINILQISLFQIRSHMWANKLGFLKHRQSTEWILRLGTKQTFTPALASGIKWLRPSGPSHSFKSIPLISNLTDSAFDCSPATSLFPQESQNWNKK